MSTGFEVSRLDYSCEARYQQPEFDLFRDAPALASHMYTALRGHGVTLPDLKIEQGDGNLGELHLFCKLFDFALTVRIRLDRVDIVAVYVSTTDQADRYSAAAVDALTAIQKVVKSGYSAYTIQVHAHGTLADGNVKAFLAQFIAKTPAAGPATGNGVGYYYGPSEDRLSSSIVADPSAIIPGGLYVRVQGIWDAARVRVQDLPIRTNTYVRDALAALNLDVQTSTAGAR